MFNTPDKPIMYTPEQVAAMLQLSKSSVYDLIKRGDIIAKKFGKVYRVPVTSLSFVFSGLDYDLYKAEQEDLRFIDNIHKTISQVRSEQ